MSNLINLPKLILLFFVIYAGFILFSMAKPKIENGTVDITPIEQVYVITLDDFSDRYKATKEILDKYNISHSKFNGTDGMKLKILDDENRVILGKELKKNTKKLEYNTKYLILCSDSTHIIYNNTWTSRRQSTAGELGCACSHVRIWEDIVKNNYQYSLILEDDIKVVDGFKTHFENLMENFPEECEIMYIHWLFFYSVDETKPQYYAFLKDEEINGNPYVSWISPKYANMYFFDSYVMKLSAAQKFIRNLPDLDYRPIDSLMFQKLVKTGEVKGCKANLVPVQKGMSYVISQDSAKGSVIRYYGRPLS